MDDEVYDEGIEADLAAEQALAAQGKPVKHPALKGISVMQQRIAYIERKIAWMRCRPHPVDLEPDERALIHCREQLAEYRRIHNSRN